MAKTWTFEGYWNAVLGANRTAEDVVREFDLASDGLGEWLDRAEIEAWVMGGHGRGEPIPAEWSEHHARALGQLQNAIG